MIFVWVFLPFSTKTLGETLTSKDIYIYTQYGLLMGISMMLTGAKLLGYNVDTPFNQLSYKSLVIFLSRVIFTITMPIFIIYLLTNFPATKILVQIRPVVIVLTVLVGVFYYKEVLTKRDYFAIVLIIMGVVLLSWKNGVKKIKTKL